MRRAIVLAVGLLVPTLSYGQFPGMGAGGRPDPEQIINFVFKGKDVLRVDEMSGFERQMWDRFAGRLGLSGNVITKDQFRGAMERAQKMAANGEFGEQARIAATGGGMGGDSGRDRDRDRGDRGSDRGGDGDRRMDEYFKRLDRDEDGVLRYDEMSETLQGERDKYDTNEDGVIDLGEFKAYVAARFPQQGGDRADGREGRRGDEPAVEERKRPTILRAGALPKDFPFASLDHDLDGQVGLYEWKESSKRISEFLSYDLNRDGFMTVEEYYQWKKQGDGGSTATAYTGGGIMDGNGRGNGNGESATPPAGKERAFGPGSGATGGGGPGAWGDRMRGGNGGGMSFPGGGMTFPGGGMSFRPMGGGPGSGGPAGDRIRGGGEERRGGGEERRGGGGEERRGGGGEERRGPGGGGERRIEIAIPGAAGASGTMTLTPPTGAGGPRFGPKGDNAGGPKGDNGGGRKEFGPRKKN